MSKTSESDLSTAFMLVLASRPNGQATMRTLIKRIPDHITLTAEDHLPSGTRLNEEMWEQRVRNTKSHDKIPGNVLCEGLVERPSRGNYRLTERGWKHLRNAGLA